jgi:ribosomal protein S18 acetylase RimI-like enzyme
LDAALLTSILDWEIEREERIAERIDRHEWGRAFLSPSLPLLWDANWVLVERAGMDVEEIIDVADDAIGSAGMDHRTVLSLDLADGNRLVPEFESRNWTIEPGVYMVWQRAPERESEVEVRECRMGEIEELRHDLISRTLTEIGIHEEAVTEQLLAWDERIGECDGDRWFVAPANRPASACRLLARGGIGQVENVATLPEARGRGLARAVTLAAARASEEDGNELTFLGAAADDWPRLLYARLGFDEIGLNYAFRLRPSKGAATSRSM